MVEHLLTAGPGVRVLATSREVLGWPGRAGLAGSFFVSGRSGRLARRGHGLRVGPPVPRAGAGGPGLERDLAAGIDPRCRAPDPVRGCAPHGWPRERGRAAVAASPLSSRGWKRLAPAPTWTNASAQRCDSSSSATTDAWALM